MIFVGIMFDVIMLPICAAIVMWAMSILNDHVSSAIPAIGYTDSMWVSLVIMVTPIPFAFWAYVTKIIHE